MNFFLKKEKREIGRAGLFGGQAPGPSSGRGRSPHPKKGQNRRPRPLRGNPGAKPGGGGFSPRGRFLGFGGSGNLSPGKTAAFGKGAKKGNRPRAPPEKVGGKTPGGGTPKRGENSIRGQSRGPPREKRWAEADLKRPKRKPSR